MTSRLTRIKKMLKYSTTMPPGKAQGGVPLMGSASHSHEGHVHGPHCNHGHDHHEHSAECGHEHHEPDYSHNDE